MPDVARRFEEMLRFRGYTEDTIYRYVRVVDQFLGQYPMTREGAISYVTQLKASSTYRRWVMYVLKLLFTTERAEWPFTSRELPKLSPAKRPFLTVEDLNRLLDIARRTPLDSALLRVAAVTGARRHELAKMLKDDYDPGRKTVRVPTGKGGDARVRSLDPETCRALDRYLDFRYDNQPNLFVSERGVPLTVATVGTRFRRLTKRAGLDSGFGIHALRRGVVTWLYQAGMREREIQDAMGWKSPSMPHLYIQLVEGEVEEKVRALHPMFKEGHGADRA